MDISAVLKAAEIQPWERKVLEQYAQLQAMRKQAALAMEYAKVGAELQVFGLYGPLRSAACLAVRGRFVYTKQQILVQDAVARMRTAQAELQAATAAADQLKLPEKPPPEIWPPDAPLVGSTVAAKAPGKPKVPSKRACRPLARALWRSNIF